MATYDAGIVTAYGAAVRGGYTGTYEEFCAQQANYAQTAAAVEQAKDDAEAAAEAAEGYAREALAVSGAYPTKTASGSIVSFNDGADGMPVKDMTVQIEPVQSGSGDPSPTNIRPISGHTSATVTRTGKNLFDKDNVNLLTAYINGSGIILRSNPDRLVYVRIKPNTVYSVTFTQKALTASAYADDCQIGFYASTPTLGMMGTRIYSQSRTSATADYTYTYTGNSGTNSWIALKVGNNERTDITASLATLQIEEGSATAYEPYTADTYTIDLGGTRYGGTLDVTSGVLTVDRQIVDLGTLTWGFSTTADNVKCYYSDGISTLIKHVASHNDTPDMISSKYQTIAWNSRLSVTNGISMLASGQIRIIDSNYQSESALSDFTASLSGVQLCYKLATPFTVQLTAQDDITTVLGQNNIWNDCGDTTVEYRADTKLYINKMLNA